jgi:hypothetical protein
VGTDSSEVAQGKGGRVEDSPEEENRRLGVVEEKPEIPGTVRSWKSCMGDSRKHR